MAKDLAGFVSKISRVRRAIGLGQPDPVEVPSMFARFMDFEGDPQRRVFAEEPVLESFLREENR